MPWAVGRHFRNQSFQVNLTGVKTGNAVIDGEVVGKKWKITFEIKSSHDDPIRGIEQLTEALSHSYETALVTSLRHAKI